MIAILLPRLSDSMEEGTVLAWLKAEGEEVSAGDELVEIETDKANMVHESDASGFLKILVQAGETVAVGTPIANLLETRSEISGADSESVGETTPPETADEQPPSEIPSGADREPNGAERDANGAFAGGVKASPVARRIAASAGLDLASIRGSGPGGRIVKADVQSLIDPGSASTSIQLPPIQSEQALTPSPAQAGRASSLARGEPPPTSSTSAGALPGSGGAPGTAKGEVQVIELTKLQQTVSRRMAESKATVPHFYLQTHIDMSRCVSARAELKSAAVEGQVIPSLNDMIVKACATALRQSPRANGAYRDSRWELYSRVNVGIAVAATNALVVPTIFDADQKGLRQIAAEARELAAKVRDESIRPAELSGATFTVTNLGMFRMTMIGPIVSPPQAAILGVGSVAPTPVVRGGEIVVADLMGVTLACDHRILYGADGAEFLNRIRDSLESPLGLAL